MPVVFITAVDGVALSDTAEPITTSPETVTTTSRADTTTTHRAVTTSATTTTQVQSGYIDGLLAIEAAVRDLGDSLEEVNQAWDDREVGLSVTDAALVEATEAADGLLNEFRQIEIPREHLFEVGSVHEQIRSTMQDITAHTRGMLEGLRSPDAGEARTEALAVVLTAVNTLEARIDRAAERVGYLYPPSRVTTTTTTRRVTTTTLSPGAAFRVGVDPHLEEVGMSFGEARSIALGICAELGKGEPWRTS